MSRKKKLLGFDLDELIQSSIDTLFESQMSDKTGDELDELLNQQKMGDAMKRHKSRFSKKGKQKAGDEGDEGGSSKTVKVKPEKIPDIDAKAIRDKIDNIRAGRSLKQDDVKEALNAYFQKLNGPERIALFAFLTGLEKILGDASTKVKPPHVEPYNIDMEQDQDASTVDKKKKSQPRGTKNVSKDKKSENPIIVGERADTRSIRSKLWR